MAKRKPKEWEHLRGVLPAAPISDDAKYVEVVSLMRRQFTTDGVTPEQAAAKWNALEEEKAELEARISALNVQIDACERIVFAHMDANDIESMQIGDGKFTRTSDPTCKQTQHVVLAWALKEMPDIVSVNYQTMQRVVKDRLRTGEAIPDGVEVTLRDRTKRTSA